ncbi:hypothetical protein BD560DRAFT_441159 [Blakeslea trispora]|nr:hypothetical protein BD560DRAFT_441159 [Blakeslea trispora]
MDLHGFTNNPHKSELLIEARFTTAEARDRALQIGLTVDQATFLGTASSTGASTKSFAHVALNLIHIPKSDELLVGLKESLRHYGTGFFDGKISFVIDTQTASRNAECLNGFPIQDLTRRLYLSYWDRHAPTSFQGAALICFYCRQAGHFRRDCPKLKDQLLEEYRTIQTEAMERVASQWQKNPVTSQSHSEFSGISTGTSASRFALDTVAVEMRGIESSLSENIGDQLRDNDPLVIELDSLPDDRVDEPEVAPSPLPLKAIGHNE